MSDSESKYLQIFRDFGFTPIEVPECCWDPHPINLQDEEMTLRGTVGAGDVFPSIRAFNRFIKLLGWRVRDFELSAVNRNDPSPPSNWDDNRKTLRQREAMLRKSIPLDQILRVDLQLNLDKVIEEDLKTAYHVTLRKNLPEILKSGLTTRIPGKQGGSSFARGFAPRAVYVIDGECSAKYIAEGGDLGEDHCKEDRSEGWVVLELDVEGYKFKRDVEYGESEYSDRLLYTNLSIPPSRIKVYEDSDE